MPLLESVRDHLYSTLYPRPCLSCEVSLSTVFNVNSCEECWTKTEFFTEETNLCFRCGKPTTSPTARVSTCSKCDGHFYDRARSTGVYSHALRAAVIGLKTNPQLSKRATHLLINTFRTYEFLNSTVIVPVPLSRQRLLERGFNQADVIATALGREIGIKVDYRSLRRNRHSPIHRVGMDQKARDLSVKNSFSVARPKLIEGQNVMLVDDVITTGATVSYCARALKQCGAKEVNVLTLARAV
jgi:ComF family protein